MDSIRCNCMTNGTGGTGGSSGHRPTLLDTSYTRNKTMVDYIFVDGTGINILMKTKVMDFNPTNPEDLPWMEKAFFQTETNRNKQMSLKPVRLFPDPFRGGKNKIVLCEIFEDDKPSKINSRHRLCECLRQLQIDGEDPWMGFEQEYFILDRNGQILGNGNTQDAKSVNSSVNFGPTAHLERQIAEQHLKACIQADLSVYGTVKETHPGQWEYQIGPVGCLRLADELIVSRYLLNRIAERFDVTISFDAIHYKDAAKTKMITSGLHLNFSTKETRAENGIEVIFEFIRRLSAVQNTTIFPFYDRNSGEDTEKRLSGARQFTPDDLNTKRLYFRIPLTVQSSKRGYLEDRRPCADCDPNTAMLGFLKSVYTQELTDTNGVDQNYG